jgi:hypothetical protein
MTKEKTRNDQNRDKRICQDAMKDKARNGPKDPDINIEEEQFPRYQERQRTMAKTVH